MTSHYSRLGFAALLLAFAVACDGTGTAAPPDIPGLGAVRPGTWYMHAANGTILPAVISDRFIGISPEQTFLDSARFLVDPNGTYQQLYWIRVLVTGTLDREEVVLDQGFWSSFGGDNQFRSLVRPRALSVGFPTAEPDTIDRTDAVLVRRSSRLGTLPPHAPLT